FTGIGIDAVEMECREVDQLFSSRDFRQEQRRISLLLRQRAPERLARNLVERENRVAPQAGTRHENPVPLHQRRAAHAPLKVGHPFKNVAMPYLVAVDGAQAVEVALGAEGVKAVAV